MNNKEYTFCGLFSEDITEIEIPIIQRDYAQGRTDDKTSKIRSRFLDNLYSALDNSKQLVLDFVYGEINNKKLIPLDGQQRLTTLFLLHWYAAKKGHVNNEECEFLNHFSYYARPATKDFCQKLTDFSPSFNGIISEEIKDRPWFQYQWFNDPTISGMLVMIDALDERFKNVDNLWQKLVKENIITFYFLKLSDMGLTDDLYVKMNSRGKPLTEFEHFKAEFESSVELCGNSDLSERINRKIDLDWTDMLFKYRGDNQIIDDEFLRYFLFISDIISYQNDIVPENDILKLCQTLYKEKAHIEFLEKAFDCWYGFDIDTFFENIFSKNGYENDKTRIYQENTNIFKQCCDDYGQTEGRNRKFPLRMTLLLYAVITYLQNKDSVSEKDFKRRIRIVRNLLWNSVSELREDNMQLLLQETTNIILTGLIPEKSSYNQRQKEEEILKIKFVENYPKYAEDLFRLEDHNLLYGSISIIGLDNPQNFNKFRELFDNCDKMLISQALLVFGNYKQKVGWREQLGGKNDSSWQDLFHRKDCANTKTVLNNLLNSTQYFNNEALTKLIDNYLANTEVKKDWCYYFVKYPEMLSETYGYYFFSNHHIFKMNTSERINGRNWNVYLHALKNKFHGKYSYGDYAYQGDLLKISDGKWLDCTHTAFYVHNKESYDETTILQEYTIPQDEYGNDKIDRFEFIINKLGL